MFSCSTGKYIQPPPPLFSHENYVMPCFILIRSLLLRRECCSFSNGEYVKAGLAELEQWCDEATEEVSSHNSFSCRFTSLLFNAMICFHLVSFYLQFAGSAWDELKHIRQAVGFLVRDWILNLSH